MVRWFGKKKKDPEGFIRTCPRCGSEGIVMVPADLVSSGGSRIPIEPHKGFFVCQQCGLVCKLGEEEKF